MVFASSTDTNIEPDRDGRRASMNRQVGTFFPAAPGQTVGYPFSLLSQSHAASLAFLILVAFLTFLPGLSTIPPIDRDEPRYAQASKQMMETAFAPGAGDRGRWSALSHICAAARIAAM